ncbi:MULTISPECIES: hypothetical protein [unclassified Mesorhizobium]|nr:MULTISPECIES: hypothetical protein [unclassified Mesorhizobium]
MAAIAGAVAASGIATAEEVDHVTREIKSFADRSDTTISLPRIFQAWGRMTY